MSVNRVILLGRLGADPEVRYSESGTAIARIRIATSERRKEGDKWVDATEWHNIITFGKTAENAGQYLSKGREVYVEGRLSTRKYLKDGVEKYFTEIVAYNIVFVGGGGNRDQQKVPANDEYATPDDDLPF